MRRFSEICRAGICRQEWVGWAIRLTPHHWIQRVIRVDWNNAGLGLPLLDLGNLLLTSHLDLNQPLQLAANESIIRMIMQRYQSERPISPREAQDLGDAMRFLPAHQAGSYLHDDRVSHRWSISPECTPRGVSRPRRHARVMRVTDVTFA